MWQQRQVLKLDGRLAKNDLVAVDIPPCARTRSSVAVAGGARHSHPSCNLDDLTGSGRRRSRPRCPSYRTQGPASA